MHDLGRGLVVLGAVLLIVGAVLLVADRVPLLGKLAGDLHFRRGSFTFYFPLASSIIISLLISLVLYLYEKLR